MYYHEETWDLSMLSGHPNFTGSKWLNTSPLQLTTMSDTLVAPAPPIIRAKFRCNYATVMEWPAAGVTSKNKKFNFSAIYGKDGENASFSKATPSGTLEITVDEGTLAFTEWVPGEEYYFNITRVPRPPVTGGII